MKDGERGSGIVCLLAMLRSEEAPMLRWVGSCKLCTEDRLAARCSVSMSSFPPCILPPVVCRLTVREWSREAEAAEVAAIRAPLSIFRDAGRDEGGGAGAFFGVDFWKAREAPFKAAL